MNKFLEQDQIINISYWELSNYEQDADAWREVFLLIQAVALNI